MHPHDRHLFAGLSQVNNRIGTITIELLAIQPDDAAYAAGLRRLGGDLVRIGIQVLARASELDRGLVDPDELLSAPQQPDKQQPGSTDRGNAPRGR